MSSAEEADEGLALVDGLLEMLTPSIVINNTPTCSSLEGDQPTEIQSFQGRGKRRRGPA